MRTTRPRWMMNFGDAQAEYVRLRKRHNKAMEYVKVRLAGGGEKEQARRRRQIAAGVIRTN